MLLNLVLNSETIHADSQSDENRKSTCATYLDVIAVIFGKPRNYFITLITYGKQCACVSTPALLITRPSIYGAADSFKLSCIKATLAVLTTATIVFAVLIGVSVFLIETRNGGMCHIQPWVWFHLLI